MSFAESLSLRAISTGPKTLLFKAALFALMELALELFAIVIYWRVSGWNVYLRGGSRKGNRVKFVQL